MLEIIGYISFVFVGFSLGFFGGGGSILAVPLLVYLFNIEPVIATAYSMIIVGFSALLGFKQNYQNKTIDLQTGMIYGIPSMISVFIVRKYLLPMIPDEICFFDIISISKSMFLMLFFSLFMLIASISMLKPSKIDNNHRSSILFLIILGLVDGLITGLVGAGGGFIIIPLLILFASLDMKVAIGTSLFIIAMKSILGFLGNDSKDLNFVFLGILILLTAFGLYIGTILAKKANSNNLKKYFAYFILITSIFILVQEIFIKG